MDRNYANANSFLNKQSLKRDCFKLKYKWRVVSPHCAGPLLLCVHSPLLPASPVLTNFNCSLSADKDENGSSIKDDKRPHRAPLPNSGRAAPPSSLYTPLPWVHPRFHRINFLVLKLDLEYETGMTVMASVKKVWAQMVTKRQQGR